MRWLVLAGLLLGAPAHADDKPWAAGVTEAHQKEALELYNKGNVAFAQAEYKDALETYALALALWDHPAIRYNAAVCRINLDRPLEAFEDLERAMKFGPAPLGPELFKQGINYQKLLGKQIAELEVAVDEPGATITLDGKLLFTAPGSQHQRVLAGDHQIVVEKPQFQTETQPVHVTGGDSKRVAITLKPLAVSRTLHRRWPAWIPWTVLALGAVPTAAGAWFFREARRDYASYDAAVSTAFNTHPGEPADAMTLAFQRDGDREAMLTYTSFAIGGALIATGFVMIVLNQPHLTVVTPVVGADHAGLAVGGSF